MHSEADEARLIGLRGYRLIARDHDAFDAVAPDWHNPQPVEAMEADKDAARPQHRTRDLIADAIGIACLFGLLGAFLLFTP